MRPTILLFPLLAAVITASACAAPDGTFEAAPPTLEAPSPEAAETAPPTPDAPTSETLEPPTDDPAVRQITTLEGDDAENYDARRPESLHLQEFTDAHDLVWRHWGPDIAVADATIWGTWCYPGCVEDPPEAMLVLCDVRNGYFTRYSIIGDFSEYDPEEWHLGYVLAFSERPYDEDDHRGCDEPDPALIG